MQPVLASAIAVLGTLLGATLSYLFQRRSQTRTLLEARRESRRKEFADALASFAVAATALRRAEFDRASKRIEKVEGTERDEARQETYRLRAETQSSYYLVRLLADPEVDNQLVDEAGALLELSRLITAGPRTLGEVRARSEAATQALDRVIDLANCRLRSERW